MRKAYRIISILIALTVVVSAGGCASGRKLEATCFTVNNSDFYEKFYSDRESSDYLIKGFDLSDEDKTYYFSEYPYLCGVKLGIEVVNKNDFDIRIIGLEIGKNGENETLLSTLPRAIVELAANTDEPSKVWFDSIADGSEFTNEELLAQMREMELRIIYVNASSAAQSPEEAAEDELIYEAVK